MTTNRPKREPLFPGGILYEEWLLKVPLATRAEIEEYQRKQAAPKEIPEAPKRKPKR